MFMKKRQEEILALLEDNRSITMRELVEIFKVPESTIRRDLTELDKQRKLEKVHGGAIVVEDHFRGTDEKVSEREGQNRTGKIKIARYAASLIKKDDFVYLDAGTTTGYMIEAIREKSAAYVTNGVFHATKLAKRGFNVHILGGRLKETTEAMVGEEAWECLERYQFNIGFFGANGIGKKTGFTTSDISEAYVKRAAFTHSLKRYVLVDGRKFGRVSSVKFGEFQDAWLLTDYVLKVDLRIVKILLLSDDRK